MSMTICAVLGLFDFLLFAILYLTFLMFLEGRVNDLL